jgi:hypothetical protein
VLLCVVFLSTACVARGVPGADAAINRATFTLDCPVSVLDLVARGRNLFIVAGCGVWQPLQCAGGQCEPLADRRSMEDGGAHREPLRRIADTHRELDARAPRVLSCNEGRPLRLVLQIKNGRVVRASGAEPAAECAMEVLNERPLPSGSGTMLIRHELRGDAAPTI